VTSQAGDRVVNVFGFGKEKGKRYPTEEELLKMIEEKVKQANENIEKAKKNVPGDAEGKKFDKHGEGADNAKPEPTPARE
jgi:hypothetical protein